MVTETTGRSRVAAWDLRRLAAVLLCVAMAWTLLPSASAAPADAGTIPKATCGADDRVETGLQGQVPEAERLTGFSGFNCNLKLVGQYQGEGAGWQHAMYGDCAYYGTAGSDSQENLGTVVIDASNPRKPKATAHLGEPAMVDPWESLKVNPKRGLLAGVENGGPGFAIYDISRNCAKPKLLTDMVVPGGRGHAGAFSADGKTYYGSDSQGTVYVIDVANPRRPRPLAFWTFPNAVHDLSLSHDGTRAYLTQKNTPNGGMQAPNGLMIIDTTDIQKRKKNPSYEVISELYWKDGGIAQNTQPVTIKGKPYLIFTDENGAAGLGGWQQGCAAGLPPFGFARIIDISNERKPTIVSRLMLEVHDPANCAETVGDDVTLFVYDSHYCSVDDPRRARLLACGYFEAGLRVFDIRNPAKPREIAYYNPPAQLAKQGELPGSNHIGAKTADWAGSTPWFAENGDIWFTTQDNGFQVVRFTKPLRKLLRRKG